jgi:hypothetical protein
VGRFDETVKESWIFAGGYEDFENYQLYIVSFYFTVTTIVTVGYGDITPKNSGERVVCILLMIIGVISFSIGTGVLSSIIANYDTALAKLEEKMSTLQEMKSEYKLDSELYKKLSNTLKYSHTKKSRDFYIFMEELPYKLKVELAMEIHKKIY